MAGAHAPENGHLFREKRHSQIRPLRTTGFPQTSAQTLISARYPKKPLLSLNKEISGPRPRLLTLFSRYFCLHAHVKCVYDHYLIFQFLVHFSKERFCKTLIFSSLKGTLITIPSNTLPWTKHPFFDVIWTRCLLK